MSESNGPRILDYGPVRLIGVARICKTSADCHNVWADEKGLMARKGEIKAASGELPYYGVCRCVTGAKEGEFEYAAMMPAAEGAPVPEGMMEIVIPAVEYAEFPVAGLNEIGEVWESTREWLSSNLQWQGYCDGDPNGCGCVDTPSFELYPPGFNESSDSYVYIPVQPSG